MFDYYWRILHFLFFRLLPRNYAETFLFVFVGKKIKEEVSFVWLKSNLSGSSKILLFVSYLKIVLVFYQTLINLWKYFRFVDSRDVRESTTLPMQSLFYILVAYHCSKSGGGESNIWRFPLLECATTTTLLFVSCSLQLLGLPTGWSSSSSAGFSRRNQGSLCHSLLSTYLTVSTSTSCPLQPN